MAQLIRTERTIAKYYLGDQHIVSDENIDSIPLETLLTIVQPRGDDPELIEGYVLNEIQLARINLLLDKKLIFDFDLYYYVLECTGIYDYHQDKRYQGMTVNERLYASGLIDEFDQAVKEKNSQRVIGILKKIDLANEETINPILKQLGLVPPTVG